MTTMTTISSASPTPASADPFARIVGQRRAVPFLKEIRDGICLGAHPHPLLFLGRSGHGKTSLSKAFADSIGAEFIRIDCGPELKSEDLVEKLTGLKSLAVIFCDELQSMKRRVQEVLYSAIDSCLVPKLEHGRLDRCAAQVAIEPFVLIGATNEPGRLLPALRARMVNIVMDDYTADDLRTIVRQKAVRFMLNLSDRAIDLIVQASGGSPRCIVQILQSIEVTSASWRFGTEAGLDQSFEEGGEQGVDVDAAEDAYLGSDESLAPEAGASIEAELNAEACLTAGFHGGPGDLLGDAAASGRSLFGVPCIPDELIERALHWMGLDLAGLDATGRTMLATIAAHGRGTAELLATVVGLDIAFTRQKLAELRARHLVHAAPGRGWVLTDTGAKLVKDLGING
jgi:Holliday junction resolvasome RuvABC ATP-dependent DNA helicase subunit